MATGKTIGQQMAELIEWAAAGKPDPRPAYLNQLEREDPDGYTRTLSSLHLFMTTCRDKAEALERATQLGRVG